MEELTVKEFAVRQGMGEMQLRRVLEHPERYPWGRYGIDSARKIGGRWRIKPREARATVVARGAGQLVEGLASVAASFEQSYPISQLFEDLQTQGAGQVISNAIHRWPRPADLGRKLKEISRTAPPPPEVISRIKPLLQ